MRTSLKTSGGHKCRRRNRLRAPRLTAAIMTVAALALSAAPRAQQGAPPAPARRGAGRAPRSRWTRRGRGCSTSATIRPTTPAAPISSADIDAEGGDRRALRAGQRAASWTSRRSPIAAASATWTFRPTCSSRSRSAAPRGHAAMVWVHGGVHGNWGISMFPFVREAVERGYVVICPEYRGSTGYGEAHHNAIDYGGYEMDDAMSAVDYLKTLPHVDQDRARDHGLEPRRLHHACSRSSATSIRSRRRRRSCRSRTSSSACRTRGRGYQRGFSTQSAHPGAAVREARPLHRALAALSRRQAQDRRSSSTSPPTTPT